MRVLLAASLLLGMSALAMVPSAQAIPPVCWAPLGEVHEQVGPVIIDSYGVRCTSVSIDEGWQPPCAATSRSVPTPDGRFTVTTTGDCTVDVILFEGRTCLGGWHHSVEHDVGPVHVTEHRCGPPPS